MENSFLNGACSGIVGITLSHPFDTIKSNIQNNTSTRYNLRNLYKGFIPPLIGVGFEKAIVFGVYTNVSNYLKEQNDITKNTISGGLAGLSASLIVTPVERIKILYQTNNKTNIFNPKYLFHGLNATFTRETPGFAIYFNVYNYLKNTTGRNDLFSSFMYGGISGSVSWLFIYPQDCIKTRMQSSNSKFLPTMKNIYKEGGFLNFYKGFHFALMRAFPLHAGAFMTMEYLKK